MAVDTSRQRLEKLYQRSGDRRLWGPTWVEFVSREPHRVIVQSRRRSRGLLNLVVVVGAIGLFGLYPAIGSFSMSALRGVSGWNDPWSCDGLRYRYEVARKAVGAPGFAEAYEGFHTARTSCESYADTLPSLTRAQSCQAAVRTYVRLLGRADARIAGGAPTAADAPWVVRVTRDRSRSADAVIGIDERASDERLAAAYLDSCNG